MRGRHARPTNWLSRGLRATTAAFAIAAVSVAGTVSGNATTTPIALGFYAPSADLSTALSQVGGHAAILNDFFGWSNAFPQNFVDESASVGAIPMITWQPMTASLSGIAAGTYDSYIVTWADAAKATGRTIYVRFAHEMNGGWYPWGYGVNGNTVAEYVAAWRHVVNLFRGQGATNVQWVWCVATGGNQTVISSLFPGDSYVDWVAMDGYNRDSKGKWRTFAQVFAKDYSVLTTLSTRPFMIAETASVESSSSTTAKAAWIDDAFLTEIPTYTRIQAAVYFDGPGGGNYSYPWDSSPSSLSAMRSVFGSALYEK